MKSIALLHTVQSVADSFGKNLQDYLSEEVVIRNLWDDYLANNPQEVGEFTKNNRTRLFMDMKSLEMTEPDLIAVTCSTLTPVVEMIRPFIKVPVIAIDDAMGKKAAKEGSNILVMATAESTLEPTVSKIQREADAMSKSVVIRKLAVTEAFGALKAMEMERHDKILKEAAKDIKGYDCIVLAQASMAHLESAIAEITGCQVLSSPGLCMEEIKDTLEKI
nr:aspartate/glutamate racemase family protein [uncultured Mediterraneibacter sp.]